jgi:hypothetical protein
MVRRDPPLGLQFGRYNSAFFSSIANIDDYVVYAAENFTQGAAFNTTGLVYQGYFLDTLTLDHIIGRVQTDAQAWGRLTPSECISAYATDFVSNRRTVVIVSNTTHFDVGEPCDNGPCLHGSLLRLRRIQLQHGSWSIWLRSLCMVRSTSSTPIIYPTH